MNWKRAEVLGWGRKGGCFIPAFLGRSVLCTCHDCIAAKWRPDCPTSSCNTEFHVPVSPECAAAEKWPATSVKGVNWILPLCQEEFLPRTQNVISWGHCVLCSGQITQMETPASGTGGTVVFLLESKNWENGSNNYTTDATKQAVGVEGSGKCFHLRVMSQWWSVLQAEGNLPVLLSAEGFFWYRSVYLSASATWAVWTSAAFLGREGYFPNPCRKCPCLRTPHTPLLGPSHTRASAGGTHWCCCGGLCTPLACGESSICVCLTRWQDPAPALKNNDFSRPSSGMSTAKAWGGAQRLKPDKNEVCLVLSAVCVDVSLI